MNGRIHAVLDGDLERHHLDPEEQRALDEVLHAIDLVRGAHQGDSTRDVTAHVLEAIDAGRRSEAAGRGARSRVRAWGAAAAALAATVVALIQVQAPVPVTVQTVDEGGTVVAAPTSRGEVPVRFQLSAPGAATVQLVGDFSAWRPAETLTKSAAGMWTAVYPLPPGVHEYGFLVDGTWVVDPRAESVPDGFGGSNARVAVVGSAAG